MKYFYAGFLGLFLWLNPTVLVAQSLCKGALHGHVYEGQKKIPLVGAVVAVPILNKGTSANTNGEYDLTEICVGKYIIEVAFIGYKPLRFEIEIKENLHTHQDIFMISDDNVLSGVVINGKIEEGLTTQAQTTLSQDILDKNTGKNLGDLLKNVAGLQALQTGAGVSKPMIHGLYGSRVLMLNNGIRQEGQQWGNDHAPEIDPFVAEQITVIKGAAGVRYGSDAIGGVVLVKPANLPTTQGLNGKINIIGASNNLMGVVAGTLEGGIKNLEGFGWRLQATAKKGGDYFAPTYILANTGLRERNFSGAMGYKKEKIALEVFFSRFDTEIGILKAAHVGNLNDFYNGIQRQIPLYTDQKFSYDIDSPKQNILHNLLKINTSYKFDHLGELQLQYGYQTNTRKEFDIRKGTDKERPAMWLDLQTHTLDASLEHHPFKGFQGTWGLATLYQFNRNNNVATKALQPIPDYEQLMQGVFIVERYIKEKYELEAAFRYDYRYLQPAFYVNKTAELVRPTYNFHNFMASLGATYHFNSKTLLKSNLGYTVRPPNVAELYSKGLHHSSGSIEEGLLYTQGVLDISKNFATEKALKWVSQLEYSTDLMRLEATFYYNFIENFVYQTPSDLRQTLRGFFPVMSYTQTNADFKGIDVALKYQLSKHFFWNNKISYLYAQDISKGFMLVNMPPFQTNNEVLYKIESFGSDEGKKRFRNTLQDFYISLSWDFVARQTRSPQVVDIMSFSTFSDEQKKDFSNSNTFDWIAAPQSYSLLNVGAGTTFRFGKQRLKVSLTAENLLNTSYRNYLNRLRYFADEVGRNVTLRLQHSF